MKKNNQHFHEDQAEPRLLTIFVTFEFFYKSHRGIMSSAKITYIFLHKIGGGGEGGREEGRVSLSQDSTPFYRFISN